LFAIQLSQAQSSVEVSTLCDVLCKVLHQWAGALRNMRKGRERTLVASKAAKDRHSYEGKHLRNHEYTDTIILFGE
jgi:hypothetical protein